jgi:hypothetical protein
MIVLQTFPRPTWTEITVEVKFTKQQTQQIFKKNLFFDIDLIHPRLVAME